MRTTERRNAIIELLCERRYEKIENLAFEFSVSECTIRRDILALSLDYPIYTRTGPFGGVYVEENYYPGRQFLHPEEEALLRKLSVKLKGDEKKLMEKILRRFGRPERKKERRKKYGGGKGEAGTS